ncbi:hypothetical protein [Halochromatium roseum]|uniref:hypothetical protein n=1 Tax=Halochromatium roseum TaxID=391920 RepID=UPI001912B3C7|nr:hypothetical protein [Halochromatium roseum]MBK5938188.1 hypothetical protein [Halochromatium roseum]
MASHFAASEGSIYIAYPKQWPTLGVAHRPRKELLQLLRGHGKGDAAWPSAYEVMRARQYVEEWQEHLADFTAAADATAQSLRERVDRIFRST